MATIIPADADFDLFMQFGDRRYIHRGISARKFERQFQLADYVTVTGASLRDGLLETDLKREVPEAVKPCKIEISETAAVAPQLANDRDERHAA